VEGNCTTCAEYRISADQKRSLLSLILMRSRVLRCCTIVDCDWLLVAICHRLVATCKVVSIFSLLYPSDVSLPTRKACQISVFVCCSIGIQRQHKLFVARLMLQPPQCKAYRRKHGALALTFQRTGCASCPRLIVSYRKTFCWQVAVK